MLKSTALGLIPNTFQKGSGFVGGGKTISYTGNGRNAYHDTASKHAFVYSLLATARIVFYSKGLIIENGAIHENCIGN